MLTPHLSWVLEGIWKWNHWWKFSACDIIHVSYYTSEFDSSDNAFVELKLWLPVMLTELAWHYHQSYLSTVFNLGSLISCLVFLAIVLAVLPFRCRINGKGNCSLSSMVYGLWIIMCFHPNHQYSKMGKQEYFNSLRLSDTYIRQ